jgi:ABC-type transport system involved in multi-copper enzyme maturation permease subunit
LKIRTTHQLAALAANTFREAIRDKILYSLLFFAALLLLVSLALQEFTIGDQEKVVRSAALGAIRLFGSIISIFLGVGLVYKELERKTIYTLASKPLARWTFLLGKYLGLMGVIAVQLALMGAFYVVLLTLQQGFPNNEVFISWFLLFMELGLLTAWALLFSSYSSPTVATAFCLSIFAIGHLADDVAMFGRQSESESVQMLAEVVYWLLPNFEVFNAAPLAAHNLPIPTDMITGAVAYGLGYTAVVLVVATMIFATRDFK